MRIQTRRQQIQELQAENKRLVKTQELLVDNILAVQENETTYTGNRYKTYAEAVAEASKKYSGQADWGVLQVGNIVDLRAAYIIGQGIKVSKNAPEGESADAELAFAERFIKANSLDHELPQDLAKEAEIEGKTLLKLFPRADKDDKGADIIDIILRWVSWTTNRYTVKEAADDYLQWEKVAWTPNGGAPTELTPDKFVYKRFAGRLDVPNETMPRVGKCLTQIENLDMALRDWRRIDELFSAPTPHVQCETAQQAKEMGAAVEEKNWRIGKFLSHTGVFGYAQPSSEGQKAIESEIITLMKLISGTTGVPINFLGAPELTTKMGSDSQALLDLIAMSTSKEREIWRGAYQELLEKAMLMWNAASQKTPLNPKLIKVDLPVVTEAQWKRITSTWLPARTGGEITRKTFLSQFPGLDVEEEIKALDKEKTENMERFADTEDDEDEDGEGVEEGDDPKAAKRKDWNLAKKGGVK
jgi:hypothetical protein